MHQSLIILKPSIQMFQDPTPGLFILSLYPPHFSFHEFFNISTMHSLLQIYYVSLPSISNYYPFVHLLLFHTHTFPSTHVWFFEFILCDFEHVLLYNLRRPWSQEKTFSLRSHKIALTLSLGGGLARIPLPTFACQLVLPLCTFV